MALVFIAAIEEAGLLATVSRVSNGNEALAYCEVRVGMRPSHGRTSCFLICICQKWMAEVLTEMRADNDPRSIPVVILTLRADKDRAHALGAQYFVTKPARFHALAHVVESTYRSLVAQA